MGFGRRKHQQDPAPQEQDEQFVDDLSPEDRAAEDAQLLADLDREQAAAPAPPPERPQGPWDVADAASLADEPRLDLGSLQVPVPPGTEVRVDVSPEGEVVAATLVQGESALQLNAFAAPRSEGIWAQVRAEIREALVEGGGQAEEADGPFGPELRSAVPTEVPGQGIVLAPARFLGVDGPRWFLRGLVTGPAALDPVLGAELEQAMRGIVVVRGTDPMAVRDALPLVLPAEALQATDQAADQGTDQGTDQPATQDQAPRLPQLPPRGPEITEIQ